MDYFLFDNNSWRSDVSMSSHAYKKQLDFVIEKNKNQMKSLK